MREARRRPGPLSVDGKIFSRYFDAFPPSRSEKQLYNWVGIRAFKYFNPNNGTLINRIFRKDKLNPDDPEQLRRRIALTKKGERDHVVASVLLVGTGLSAAALFPELAVPILTATIALEIPGNLYPIMLQRYNRYIATEQLNTIAQIP